MLDRVEKLANVGESVNSLISIGTAAKEIYSRYNQTWVKDKNINKIRAFLVLSSVESPGKNEEEKIDNYLASIKQAMKIGVAKKNAGITLEKIIELEKVHHGRVYNMSAICKDFWRQVKSSQWNDQDRLSKVIDFMCLKESWQRETCSILWDEFAKNTLYFAIDDPCPLSQVSESLKKIISTFFDKDKNYCFQLKSIDGSEQKFLLIKPKDEMKGEDSMKKRIYNLACELEMCLEKKEFVYELSISSQQDELRIKADVKLVKIIEELLVAQEIKRDIPINFFFKEIPKKEIDSVGESNKLEPNF